MLLHKLHAAWFLGSVFLAANARATLRAFRRPPRQCLRELRQAAVRLWLALFAVLFRRGKFRVGLLVRLCLSSGVPRATLERNLETAVALAERDVTRQQYDRAEAVLTPHIDAAGDHPKAAKCLGLRSLAHQWRGHHAEAIADLTRCAALRPKFARVFHHLTNLAQMHGVRGEVTEARRAMAAGRGAGPKDDPAAFLAKTLKKLTEPYLAALPSGETVGVMIGSYHHAYGHAVLDPFHFDNLFRHRFDNLVVLHPAITDYSRATALMTSIVGQYAEPIGVPPGPFAPFAWQFLGELPAGPVTFLCHNYWSLNRLAYHARRDPAHPMNRGRRYLQLPPRAAERAERFCRKNGLDTGRPVVVLHARSHGYHRLRVQSFRNVEVRNYVPAVRRLLDLGYAVVRIGEKGMESLRGDAPGVIELPGLRHYDHSLDAYFLARCEFMISCQSGPCSLARAFGKPNLVVNGVYHHTMLPEQNELFVFKRYRDAGGAELGLEELLARGCHLFDRSSHFEAAGIDLEDATADEILAATEEMLAGLAAPGRADTAPQAAFRDLMLRYADFSHPLATRMTDYIGYSLPEGRVSDAVCRMRPGYVEHRARRPAAA